MMNRVTNALVALIVSTCVLSCTQNETGVYDYVADPDNAVIALTYSGGMSFDLAVIDAGKEELLEAATHNWLTSPDWAASESRTLFVESRWHPTPDSIDVVIWKMEPPAKIVGKKNILSSRIDELQWVGETLHLTVYDTGTREETVLAWSESNGFLEPPLSPDELATANASLAAAVDRVLMETSEGVALAAEGWDSERLRRHVLTNNGHSFVEEGGGMGDYQVNANGWQVLVWIRPDVYVYQVTIGPERPELIFSMSNDKLGLVYLSANGTKVYYGIGRDYDPNDQRLMGGLGLPFVDVYSVNMRTGLVEDVAEKLRIFLPVSFAGE